ncbi:MAG TPA: GGDEF domain-containing protein [Anaerolineales bacterium]|nr:GGDEF domain-containing protein [Anaerolineales bacterium]
MNPSDIKVYRLLTWLETLPKSGVISVVISVMVVLGSLDYLTGFELSFSFFYLLPVTMATWVFGRNTGLVFSVLSATSWLTTNLLAGQDFSNLFIGVWNTLIRFGFYVTVTILLAELHHALETERLLANTDPLTGALNRRSFNEIAENRMIVSEVNRRPYTMVYIDLDNFKSINDTMGHAEGDLVLKTVVDAIQAQIRSTDFLARLGGDEFAVLLTNIDQEQAKSITERLQSALLQKMKYNEWGITFSIGVLTVLSMPESPDRLVSLSDALMYEVKSKGKNAIQYSTYE